MRPKFIILFLLILINCLQAEKSSFDVSSSPIFVLATALSSANTTSTNKIIFITAATYNGALGGVSSADTKCQADSNKPSGTSIYKALLVDGANRDSGISSSGGTGTRKDWVFQANTTYTRPDGTEIFTTNDNSLFDFSSSLTNSWKAPSGTASYAWTGLLSQSWDTAASNLCLNWSSNNGSSSGKTGGLDSLDSNSISFSTMSTCASLNYLICVEQ